MSRFDDEVWRKRDGASIRVGDMTPRHALNSWRMLLRSLYKLAWNSAMRDLAIAGSEWGPQGDAACDAFEREMDYRARFPCSTEERNDIVKALWLRSLDEWAPDPEEWGGEARNERVALWDRFPQERAVLEHRWAACAAVGPRRWRPVCVGDVDSVWAFTRDGADRMTTYKIVRLEYVDPITGVYTEDTWEIREREMMLRRNESRVPAWR